MHTSKMHAVIQPRVKLKFTGGPTHWRKKTVHDRYDQKKRRTYYKDTMRPQQAIRSYTEHICTTMFISRRIYGSPLFLLEDDRLRRTTSPGASFAPKRIYRLGSLNESTISKARLHTAPQVNAAH